MKQLMWKLLRKHVSVGQFIGFSLANLIGLGIVIVALQFYVDVRPIFEDEDGFLNKDFLVITRQVSSAGVLVGGAEFDQDAIDEIKSQPWVRSVGAFGTSTYKIYASIGVGNGRAVHTQFFFESIPDEYIDVPRNEWGFSQGDSIIPVIMSKDYLSLYNFGFAATSGLPQISEGMAGMIPLSFFVLMLSIYLLLQKNVKKLKDLLLLGYSPAEVSQPYVRMVVILNAAILIMSIILMLLVRIWYLPKIEAMGSCGGSIWLSVTVGFVIMLAITIGNVMAIRGKIRGLWLD